MASTDLDDLIRHGDLKNLISQVSPTGPPPPSPLNPPAYTKEKGEGPPLRPAPLCCLSDPGLSPQWLLVTSEAAMEDFSSMALING